MKLSDNTLNILVNFSKINTNIHVQPGNTLKTINSSETVFAVASVPEMFDSTFSFYELNRFLATHSLFDQPELTFGDSSVLIESGKKSVKYTYSDPETLLYPKVDTIETKSSTASFDLTKDQFVSVLKSSLVIGLSHVSFVGKNGKVSISSMKKNDPLSDSFTLDLDCACDKDFECVILIERLESILPADYSISISDGLVHWSNKNINLQYWLASEIEN